MIRPSKLERYMGFLLQQWEDLAKVALRDPTAEPLPRSVVLDHTIAEVGNAEGLRLEFGVWQGKSITHCARQFPDVHWYGFDSFEGFPDDGRVDWQKPFKVIALPDTPDNVTLIKGYFSQTLDPFLQETKGPVAFINVDCDIYSSTVDIFTSLERNGRLVPGVVVFFDELINYVDFMYNEALALFEMCERTGLGLQWIACDHRLRTPERTAQHFHDADHPTWMDDMRSGYWMQASCRLTGGGISYGPMDDPAYREKLAWMVEGYENQDLLRHRLLEERNARLKEMEVERERRLVERKKREKQRQLENLERRRLERDMKKNS